MKINDISWPDPKANNESAKMKTSKGVIQGYDGVTTVDGKKQVMVAPPSANRRSPSCAMPSVWTVSHWKHSRRSIRNGS